MRLISKFVLAAGAVAVVGAGIGGQALADQRPGVHFLGGGGDGGGGRVANGTNTFDASRGGGGALEGGGPVGWVQGLVGLGDEGGWLGG